MESKGILFTLEEGGLKACKVIKRTAAAAAAAVEVSGPGDEERDRAVAYEAVEMIDCGSFEGLAAGDTTHFVDVCTDEEVFVFHVVVRDGVVLKVTSWF